MAMCQQILSLSSPYCTVRRLGSLTSLSLAGGDGTTTSAMPSWREFEFPASGFNLAQPLMSQGFEVNQKTEDLFLCLSLQQTEGKYTTNKNFKINKVNMRDRHLSEQYVRGKRDGRWGLRGFRCLSPTWQAWIQGVDCHP